MTLQSKRDERSLKGAIQDKFTVVPHPQTRIMGERASTFGGALFSIVIFGLTFGLVLALSYAIVHEVALLGIIIGIFVAGLATMTIHTAAEWEKVVILRLGKFNRVEGPGLFFTIPIIEAQTMRVDERTRVTTFGAKDTLTSDLVPLDVDAALFWVVWDPKAACVEVGDFTRAVEMSAQTALRDAIGRGGVAEVAIRRDQLDRELKNALADKVAAWGVTILSVEVRDIVLPKELQESMSLEAQAEQRKKSRIILMEAERDIADMLEDVSDSYDNNDSALRLRMMHLMYESVRETGGTVVIPSTFSEGFSEGFEDVIRKSVD